MPKIVESLINKPENIELLSLLEAHDLVSYDHSLSVANTAEILFPIFKFGSNVSYNDVVEGALLHDVGKIFVSPEILNKKGPLTVLEFSIIKEHPRCGGVLLYDRSEIIKNIVHLHHERLDGSGYPYCVKGEHIPDYCRFITAIDILDALLSKRPYKDPLPYKNVYEEIKNMYNGKNFDMYYFIKILDYLQLKEECVC